MSTPSPDTPQGPLAPHEATRLLREIQSISDHYETHLARRLDVNPTDVRALNILVASGPLSPSALAQRLGLSNAAGTVVVDRLVRASHVVREPNPADRRSVRIVPTPEAIARARGELVPMVRAMDGLADGFSDDEQRTIVQYLTRVVDAYRAQLDEPSDG